MVMGHEVGEIEGRSFWGGTSIFTDSYELHIVEEIYRVIYQSY